MSQFKKKILVIGDIMLDRYISGSTNRISPEAPVPVMKFESGQKKLGGAATVKKILLTLGVRYPLLDVIGSDKAGKEVLRQLNESKINFIGEIKDTTLTIQKIRYVSNKQQLLRLDLEDNEYKYSLNILGHLKKNLDEIDAVIISDYGKEQLVKLLLSSNTCTLQVRKYLLTQRALPSKNMKMLRF